MAHANAKLTEFGRMLLVSRIDAGWTQAEAAEMQGVSRSTAAKWWKRYKSEGVAGLKDRSSRAHRLPHALGETVIEAICQMRRELGAGPHRLAYHLKLAASTVYAVLRRAGLSVLARLDRTTRAGRRGGFMGSPAFIRENLRRYEAAHLDAIMFIVQCGARKHEDIMSSLELFAKEVMPEFADRHAQQQRWRTQQLDSVDLLVNSSI